MVGLGYGNTSLVVFCMNHDIEMRLIFICVILYMLEDAMVWYDNWRWRMSHAECRVRQACQDEPGRQSNFMFDVLTDAVLSSLGHCCHIVIGTLAGMYYRPLMSGM